jgi:hypothetical protein
MCAQSMHFRKSSCAKLVKKSHMYESTVEIKIFFILDPANSFTPHECAIHKFETYAKIQAESFQFETQKSKQRALSK